MAEIEALRREQLLRSPTILRGAFRLLFLGGSVWALVDVVLWVLALNNLVTLPTAMAPLAWHQHEMLFGYLGAVIAGFLSAAVPNWTGRLPFAGWKVAVFVGIWFAARIGLLFSTVVSIAYAAVIDVGFLLLLAVVTAREIIAAHNRNIPIIFVLLLLALASALDFAEALGWHGYPGLGVRAGVAIVLVLIATIGGRIIPAFTRNWLARQGSTLRPPSLPQRFDRFALAIAALALAVWTGWPDSQAAGGLLVLSGVIHLIRLAGWSGFATIRDPLVFILHLGYAWLPFGLLLLGASIFTNAIAGSAALHALTAGSMATMTLAVMSRATLGHTGRPLVADRATAGVYLLVTLGALLRVAAPCLPMDYMLTIRLAGILWSASFLLFAFAYAPKLLGPRADGKPF